MKDWKLFSIKFWLELAINYILKLNFKFVDNKIRWTFFSKFPNFSRVRLLVTTVRSKSGGRLFISFYFMTSLWKTGFIENFPGLQRILGKEIYVKMSICDLPNQTIGMFSNLHGGHWDFHCCCFSLIGIKGNSFQCFEDLQVEHFSDSSSLEEEHLIFLNTQWKLEMAVKSVLVVLANV